ncbi:PEBP-like protein [Periconia macrospinosa]|uniref:PEBP-like protein n=1 Tax=Periconia macrospinosa TaxID=97972 RepID=A0A2V1D7G2_9PLEO|nr:PEBP-like protein [Periconia macrospinosa]
MWLLNALEYILGRLLYRRRGYDALLFHNLKPFAAHPTPSLKLTSPDCGASGAQLSDTYSAFGAGHIPTLQWPAASASTAEYLLLSEDADAPLGHPNVHGIYTGIPRTTTSISPADLEVVGEESDGVKVIKSGWRVGWNRRGKVYIPPRPPRGHGAHRYFFVLVALREKLDWRVLGRVPRKGELIEAVDGKVEAWGVWEGRYESRF